MKSIPGWCKHIKWFGYHVFWWGIDLSIGHLEVPRSWKCCPICETKRPKKKGKE